MSNLPPDFGQLAREADKRARLAQVKLDELSQRQGELLAEVVKSAQAASSEIFSKALYDKQPGSLTAVLNNARASFNSNAEHSKRATLISYAVLAGCVLSAVISMVALYMSLSLANETDESLNREQARQAAAQKELVAPRAKHK